MSEEWEGYFSNATEACIYGYIKTMCDNVGVCRASVPMIARKAYCTARWATKTLRLLAERGFITIEERAGKTTLYKANPCRKFTPEQSSPLNKIHPTPEQNSSPDIIIDNNIYKIKLNKKNIVTTTPKKFVKPTEDEVAQYCAERGNDINAAEFVDFYESKGWVVGKSPMKDWRAAVRTWENSHKKHYNNEQRNSKNRQYNQEVDAAIIAGLLAK